MYDLLLIDSLGDSTVVSCLVHPCGDVQESLWKTLNDSPLFRPTETGSTSELPRWSYHVPDPATQPTPPLLPALTRLQSSVAQAVSARPTHRFQHTLQSLIDFTGYLTTKTYALASAMHRLPGITPSSATAIEEEEIRMEIKALKGLVLNRYVFTTPHSKVLLGHTNATLTDVVIGGRSFRLLHGLQVLR